MRRGVDASRRIVVHIGALLCLLTAFTSCARREKVHHGVEVVDGGMRLRVASLGSCGCVTLQNKTKEPREAIALVAAFKGAGIGVQVLEPDKSVRARFDWAGRDGDDVYDIIAYSVTRKVKDKAGKDTDANVRVNFAETSIDVGGVIDTRCNDEDSCEYGSLNMNRAAAAPAGQDAVQTSQRGVHAVKDDEVLEVAAARERCGCVVLRNESSESLYLTATLRGTPVGGMRLVPNADRYIGFDWAGDLGQDIYVISALIPGTRRGDHGAGEPSTVSSPAMSTPRRDGPSPQPPSPAPGAEPPASGASTPSAATSGPQLEIPDRTVKFGGEKGVRIVGQMDGMECTLPRRDEDRQALEQKLLAEFRDRYPEEQIRPKWEQMAKYAAGARGVLIPEFDVETVKKIGENRVKALLKELDTRRGPVADGAAFELPTGDRISCPFGELNMDQMWRRRAPPPAAGTQRAPQPNGQGGALSPRKE
jgi:hypothetical protein